MVEKTDLFEDVSVAIDSWVSVLTNALTAENADLRWTEDQGPFERLSRAITAAHVDPEDVRHIASECLRGFAVSFFTVLDGGSASAELGRVRVVDERGRPLGEGLHDGFVRYLADAGKL